jgi:hypothetical protein
VVIVTRGELDDALATLAATCEIDIAHPPEHAITHPCAPDPFFEAFVFAARAHQLTVAWLADGGAPPQLAALALDKGAQVLEVFRTSRRVSDGRIPLTEADMGATRRLADLVRAGAPQDEVMRAARIVHAILHRPDSTSAETRELAEAFTRGLDVLAAIAAGEIPDDHAAILHAFEAASSARPELALAPDERRTIAELRSSSPWSEDLLDGAERIVLRICPPLAASGHRH